MHNSVVPKVGTREQREEEMAVPQEVIRQLAHDFATSEAYKDPSDINYHISEVGQAHHAKYGQILPGLQDELKKLQGVVAIQNLAVVQAILAR